MHSLVLVFVSVSALRDICVDSQQTHELRQFFRNRRFDSSDDFSPIRPGETPIVPTLNAWQGIVGRSLVTALVGFGVMRHL